MTRPCDISFRQVAEASVVANAGRTENTRSAGATNSSRGVKRRTYLCFCKTQKEGYIGGLCLLSRVEQDTFGGQRPATRAFAAHFQPKISRYISMVYAVGVLNTEQQHSITAKRVSGWNPPNRCSPPIGDVYRTICSHPFHTDVQGCTVILPV